MALRVLTQINYSAGVNPEGDSGLYFLAKLLLSIVSKDNNVHFYVLIPKKHEQVWVSALLHPRIATFAMNLEPRLHGGSFMFDPADLYNNFDFAKYDIDVLFMNQPETAPALLNFLNRQMFHLVPAVSYIHWFDTRLPGTPKKQTHYPALLGVLSGMMVSAIVGVNSKYAETQIIKQSRKWFNDLSVDNLRQKIRIMPPGIDSAEILPILKARKKVARKKVQKILINHRLLNYTGVRNLLTDIFPKLREQREDFSVHATNPSRVILPGSIVNKPWLKVETLSKEQYLKLLGKCDIVVSPHKAAHWSISTLEAICAGCVPLMNKESFFPEMISPVLAEMPVSTRKHITERWFYHRRYLILRLNALMDNIITEKAIALEFAEKAAKVYDWQNVGNAFNTAFYEAAQTIPAMPEMTPSLRKVFSMLLEDGSVSKAEILRRLGWRPKNRTVAWTAFRKNLKKYACECADKSDAVFNLREECREELQNLINNPILRKNNGLV